MTHPVESSEPPGEETVPEHCFTLHIDFVAMDEMAAICHASQYAEGLSILRPEVCCNSARVSTSRDWSRPKAVFCHSFGPRVSDICTEVADHGGWHFGPEDHRHWTDEEVPLAAIRGAPSRAPKGR